MVRLENYQQTENRLKNLIGKISDNITEKLKAKHWTCSADDITQITNIKIIEALEKQMPKKPLYIEGDCDMPLCPNCGMFVDVNEEKNYCSVCGQALELG